MPLFSGTSAAQKGKIRIFLKPPRKHCGAASAIGGGMCAVFAALFFRLKMQDVFARFVNKRGGARGYVRGFCAPSGVKRALSPLARLRRLIARF